MQVICPQEDNYVVYDLHDGVEQEKWVNEWTEKKHENERNRSQYMNQLYDTYMKPGDTRWVIYFF